MTTNPRKGLLNDASISDLLFQCMMTATAEQKEKMPPEWLKYFADRKTIHRFCLHQAHERQMIMWHMLGFSWVTIFGMDEETIGMCAATAADQHKIPAKRKDFINAMSEKKVCATSSREMVMNMMMIDIDSKSANYTINKNAQEISRHSRRWNKMPTTDMLQREAAGAYQSLARIIGNVLLNKDNIVTLTGYSALQFQILLFLIEDRYSAFTMMAIANKLGKQNELKKFKASLDYLLHRDLLIVDIKEENKSKGIVKDTSILIGEKGIRVVMGYLNGVMNKALK